MIGHEDRLQREAVESDVFLADVKARVRMTREQRFADALARAVEADEKLAAQETWVR